MADNDAIVLEDARDAAFILDKAYRRAVRERDLNKMRDIKPHVDDAYDKVSQARLKLLEQGVLATDEDVADMRRIKAEIDEAASTQQLIQGAIKLVGLIAKFV